MTIAIRRPTRFAPLIALALLLLLPEVSPEGFANSEGILARNAQVARVFRAAPYRIGNWLGEDVEVPSAAIEILRPNAILSRRFERLDGEMSVDLIIVHCSDARDMQGHYPPNCYPANGWHPCDREEQHEWVVLVGGQAIAMRVYSFRRIEGWGSERTLRVFNYFLVPNGEMTSDFGVMRRLASRLALSVQGVAQVQVVMSGESSFQDSIEAAEELLSGFSSIMAVLAQGKQHDYTN